MGHTNAQCAHIWAQQNADRGKTNNGNMFFEGSTIYSYGYHYPLARFMRVQYNGEIVDAVLVNITPSSVTTEGKHKNAVNRAISSDTLTFRVPTSAFSRWHQQNEVGSGVVIDEAVSSYKERIDDLIKQATRARLVNNKLRLINAAQGLDAELLQFCNALDCMKHYTERDWSQWQDLQARAHELEIKERAEADRLLAARVKRWLDGEHVDISRYSKILLRRHPMAQDCIQTSWGAEVPLDEAKQLIRGCQVIARAHANTIGQLQPSKTIRVGHFSLDYIDVEHKYIKVGCHRLTFDVINEFVDYAAQHLDIGVDASYKLP